MQDYRKQMVQTLQHVLHEHEVEQEGGYVATSFKNYKWTYSKLSRFSYYLICCGARPQDRCAIQKKYTEQQ